METQGWSGATGSSHPTVLLPPLPPLSYSALSCGTSSTMSALCGLLRPGSMTGGWGDLWIRTLKMEMGKRIKRWALKQNRSDGLKGNKLID